MALDLHKELGRLHREKGRGAREKASQMMLSGDPTGQDVRTEAARAKLYEGKAAFFERAVDFMRGLVKEGLPEPGVDDYLEALKLREQKPVLEPAEEKKEGVASRPGKRRKEITLGQEVVALKAKRQYPIAKFLSDRAGQVVEKEVLARVVYGDASLRAVQKIRNDVMDIRRDLEAAGVQARVETAGSDGYRVVLGRPEELGRKGEKKARSLVSLPDAARRAGLTEVTVRNLVERGGELFKDGVHYVSERQGKGRVAISVTPEGEKRLSLVKKESQGKKRIFIATVLDQIKGLLEGREKKGFADFKQVRPNVPKLAKLAHRLGSLPVDVERDFGVSVRSDKRAMYGALWDTFCGGVSDEERKRLDFERVIIPQLRDDLRALAVSPEKALRFFSERRGDENIIYVKKMPELYVVLEDVLYLLIGVEAGRRKMFADALLELRGPLLQAGRDGLVVRAE